MQIKTILFPTDFSQGARAAMDHAISLARDYDAKLILLYVIQDISIAEWYIPSSLSVNELVEDMQKSAWNEMKKWGAEVSAKVKDVDSMVVRGVPFVEIIKTAKEKKADLIVIGTHGRTGIDHMLGARPKRSCQGILPRPYGAHRWERVQDAVKVRKINSCDSAKIKRTGTNACPFVVENMSPLLSGSVVNVS
jgi:nucleotide-binding universal stress UspA family protein